MPHLNQFYVCFAAMKEIRIHKLVSLTFLPTKATQVLD